MRFKFTGLWRHPDFVKLWSGQTISVFGSQVTFLALPLTAVVILKASPLEMGILDMAGFLPFLLLSLFVGVWVDRMRRRPILILADFSRFILLGSIPIIYLLNLLTIYHKSRKTPSFSYGDISDPASSRHSGYKLLPSLH